MKVVLGVTGSIAAYKACELVRLLVKRGDDVHVVMTEHARAFVTPLTFQTLSRNPVACDLFADPQDWKPGHVSLAASADLVVVAPATANILAKMAHGIADDLLSSTLLATKAQSRHAGERRGARGARRAHRVAGGGRSRLWHGGCGPHGRTGRNPFSL